MALNNYLKREDLRRQFIDELRKTSGPGNIPSDVPERAPSNGSSGNSSPWLPKWRDLPNNEGTTDVPPPELRGGDSQSGRGNFGLREPVERIRPLDEPVFRRENPFNSRSPWDISYWTNSDYEKINKEMDDVISRTSKIDMLMQAGKREDANKEMYALLEKYNYNPRWDGLLTTLAASMDYEDPEGQRAWVTTDPFTRNLRKWTNGGSDKWITRRAVTGIQNHVDKIRSAWEKAHSA